MRTIDLKRTYAHLYRPPAKVPSVVDVPELRFIMIDGAVEEGGEPGTSPGFQAATEALYGISYTLKFMLKKRQHDPVDYPVMALEGLWWVEDGRFDISVKDNWKYTLMIMQPDVVTEGIFAAGLAELERKRGSSPAFEHLKIGSFDEGLSVQVLHVGPYAEETATVERMRAFMEANGLRDLVGYGGKHHEIYLGDPRRAAPEKLKTVLRHPTERV